MKFAPMLCAVGKEVDLQRKNFIYEPKLDGIRALCYVNGHMRFITRNLIDRTTRYPELQDIKAIKAIKAKSCVLDGEIIVYDQNGRPDFGLLQNREGIIPGEKNTTQPARYLVTYVVFDILEKDGKSLIHLPLLERKKILEKTVNSTNRIQKIFFTHDGLTLWEEMRKLRLEGVIAKEQESEYYSGLRSSVWLKIKFMPTIDCVILGFTQGRRKISSLALGLYDAGKLVYVGKVGTGFSHELIAQLYPKLDGLRRVSPPKLWQVAMPQASAKTPRTTLGVTPQARSLNSIEHNDSTIIWVRAKYVAEVGYAEFTHYGLLRQARLLRIRTDKNPKSCTFSQ